MTTGGLRLVADIGGTNARFALVRASGPPEAVRQLPLSGFGSFDEAARSYLEGLPELPSLTGMAIAAAGPVRAGKIRMTNAAWELDPAAISEGFDGVPVILVNDLAAVAMSLPVLTAGDVQSVRAGRQASEPQPLLAINVGTGLGAAVAIPAGSSWRILPTEAGHIRLGASSPEDLELFQGLVTVEDLIAGPGWQRFCQRCPPEVDAARLFSRVLGRFAGDMVLATGAWGGVYFCGGVMDSWPTLIEPDTLMAHFDDHGPMLPLLNAVPLYRVTALNPALLGLANAQAGGAQP